jgi:cellulose synthase/poly-beta-1,6-N-acetylglucosamine synthase-like glycosyltransferase
VSKVLLAAIAKDEAAYLPEWIYYHLSIGIDEIVIYVNSTTDNTIQILDKLKENLPVKYVIADGIEKIQNTENDQLIDTNFMSRNPLQSKAYANIYTA